jgi:homocysteine S-methyltransferase
LTPDNPADEIRNLRRKVQAGADFVLTQPIFDVASATAFLKGIEENGGPLGVPILMGVLPLANQRHAAFLHQEVPGILIPDVILQRMEAAGDDGLAEGKRIAMELISAMRPLIQGIYLMPAFSRFDIAAEIIEQIRKQEVLA